jgi:hypothetical protein
MEIRSDSESHAVELDDGLRWQIFPGDLDLTLHWKPKIDLKLVRKVDEVGSLSLVKEPACRNADGSAHLKAEHTRP